MIKLTVIECKGESWDDCYTLLNDPVLHYFVSDSLVTYNDIYDNKHILTEDPDLISRLAISSSSAS